VHRFFVDQKDVINNTYHTTDPTLCHQIYNVLKMKERKQIILCTNDETEHVAEWTVVAKSKCTATILESIDKPDISTTKELHLAVALLKNQNRWEWILEKGTELGVKSFIPLITERTETEKLRKPERLERIIQEAAEQSGRTILPHLRAPKTLEAILQTDTEIIIATLHPSNSTATDYPLPTTLCIGPEGGFTKEEIQLATYEGAKSISLGPQTLRTETAAIIASSYLLKEYTS
jgi:16S rRNA (uracil1498-N3)-methyltransferase